MASLGARPSLEHFRLPEVYIKLPEILLLLIAVITYFAGDNGSPAYVSSILLPCLLNSLVFMINYVLGYNQLKHTPVELALYSYYIIGLFISAILLLSSAVPSLIASGVFCILLTLVYCLELYYSYKGLVNRVPLPENTQGTDPTQGNDPNPSVISGPPPAYSSSPSPAQPGTDTIDLGRTTAPWPSVSSTYSTNPVYPSTMNYPPYPTTDTTTIPPKTQEEPHP